MRGASRRRPLVFAALFSAAAAASGVAMWGFTIDDALISIAYARNLVTGAGYRLSPHALPSDGVTPLPWAPLLAPLSAGDALDALVRAKALGLAAWCLASARLGAFVGARTEEADAEARLPTAFALVGVALVALVFPLGAHAVSGMETGVVLALCTLASSARGPRTVAALAGVAAAFRPELAPWALTLSCARAGLEAEGAPVSRVCAAALPSAISVTPFVVVAALRLALFGSPAPLSALAKPSDLTHGARYALAAAIVTAVPIGLLAPRALLRASARGQALALATSAHFVALVVAGGDWMPYARLAVPVVPGALLALLESSVPRASSRLRVVARLGVVTASALLALRAAPSGRFVMRDRAALVSAARPALARARVIAALDVGWVSAAAPGARLVDLAGVTDRTIAALPGGHTSKRVDLGMLLEREVDVIVTLESPRLVERRITGHADFASRFERVARLDAGRGGVYLVWARR